MKHIGMKEACVIESALAIGGCQVTELGCGMETHWVDGRADSAVFSLCGWLGEGGSIGCHAGGRIEVSRRDDPGPSRSQRDS